jgi:serine/threonine protein phosphatase PrpC
MGDLVLSPAVTWEPDIVRFTVPQEQGQSYLIVASDGLWDVIQLDYLAHALLEYTSLNAGILISLSKVENADDNVSAIVARLTT